MMNHLDVVVGLITVKNKRQGKRLAKILLEKRLVACVNIIGDVESMYRWEGRLVSDPEVVLVFKTCCSVWKSLETTVRENHSYDLPEILALPVVEGFAAYLNWVKDSVG